MEALADPELHGALARHQAGLLSDRLTADLHSLDSGFAFRGEGLVSLPIPLGKALSRAGVSSPRAREALIAEVQHLALVVAGLADDFCPQVHLAVVKAGEPIPEAHRWPVSAKLALLYVFDIGVPGSRSGATPFAAVLAEDDGEILVSPSPQSAAVLKLDSAVAVRCVPVSAQAGAGERLLMLWVASEQTPAWAAAWQRGWARLSAPEPVDVLLVSMPFGPVVQPSLGLGLLKSALPAGTAKVLYPSLVFARRIGRPLYHWISDCLPFATTLVGEWLFRAALFPEHPEDPGRYLENVLLRSTSRWRAEGGDAPSNVTLVPDGLVADLLQARELADELVDWCVDEVLAHRPKIVGLTSVFQQHAASLALARRLKARSPETLVVLGGSNCEGVMALATMRAFGFLDAVVSGEGEVILPQLVERWLAGRPIDDLQGVYTSTSPEVVARAAKPANAPSPRHLDDLPYPDFDDFFDQFHRAGFVEGERSRILFETSRGCWWGEVRSVASCSSIVWMRARRRSATR